jgi:ABC-type nitrate/sulfonate/bicarbonate transport system substrate-binding protein
MKILCIGMVFVLLSLPGSLRAQGEGPLEKMRVLYSAGGSHNSVWIPHEAGIFRKNGLDVELLFVAGGSTTAQVVQSGQAPIGIFTGSAVVTSGLAGGDLVAVAGVMNVIPFFVMARPEIRRVEDLKGKKVGITRFGSASDFALRYTEEKWPVKRGRDFAVLQNGSMPANLLALKSGAAEGAMLSTEFAALIRRDGFRELADVASLGLHFPTSAIITTRSFIRRNENAVRKFLRGFVEGIHYAKTHREFSIEVFRKYLKNEDRQLLNVLYDLYVLKYVPRVPHPTAEPFKTVLAQIAETDPKAASAKPESFIEPRFIQDLEREGFIQRLWQ